MRYAVLDWDNTVRTGFTLFSWIDFLLSRRAINGAIEYQLDSLQKAYHKGEINHDDYADIAGRTYAFFMKGFREKNRQDLVKEYLRIDRLKFFSFSETIFELLRMNDIRPIIISGAPEYILEEYKEILGIYDIYAFCEESKNGICNGNVKYNYGSKKQKTIEMLIRNYGEYPTLGFGDSYSDIPLFQFSQKAFCIIGENNPPWFGENLITINRNTNRDTMRSMLEQELKEL